MNNAKKMVVAAVMAAAAAVCMADTKTTYRDAQGRVQGSQTTDRYGKTTYRDSMGRVQGTKLIQGGYIREIHIRPDDDPWHYKNIQLMNQLREQLPDGLCEGVELPIDDYCRGMFGASM